MGIFVDRDGSDNIIGRYANAQYEGQEYLADGSEELTTLALDDAKAAKVEAAEGEYTSRLGQGFAYDDKVYQLDDASQARITSMGALAGLVVAEVSGAAWPNPFGFITADNEAVPFTAAQFVPLASAAAARVFALRTNARALKDAILAAEDQAALDAIDITAGWD
jgi:hypothetical protein